MESQVKFTSDRSQPDRSEDIVLSRCGSTDRHVDFVPSGPGTRSNFQGTPFWRIEACGPVGELWRVRSVGRMEWRWRKVRDDIPSGSRATSRHSKQILCFRTRSSAQILVAARTNNLKLRDRQNSHFPFPPVPPCPLSPSHVVYNLAKLTTHSKNII